MHGNSPLLYTPPSCTRCVLQVQRLTTSEYVDVLAASGLFAKYKVGRGNSCICLALNAALLAEPALGA